MFRVSHQGEGIDGTDTVEGSRENVRDDATCNQPIECTIKIHARIVGSMHFELTRCERVTC
jgi:hypothetical protein